MGILARHNDEWMAYSENFYLLTVFLISSEFPTAKQLGKMVLSC